MGPRLQDEYLDIIIFNDLQADTPMEERKCYPAVRHITDGDVVQVRDCVLVSSGPRKTDIPYVAKIAALWEAPDTGMWI